MESQRPCLRPIEELAHAYQRGAAREGYARHPAGWRCWTLSGGPHRSLMLGLSSGARGSMITHEASKAGRAQGRGVGQHGTTPAHRRFCGMKRLTLGTKAASIRQKLATTIALLAAVMFVMHAAAAKGTGTHLHDHHLPHAGALLVTGDGAHEPGHRHEHPQVGGHMHGSAGKGSPPCCGDACLAALVPDEDPPLGDLWGMPSRCSVTALSLTGHDPEQLRRPPRLSRVA